MPQGKPELDTRILSHRAFLRETGLALVAVAAVIGLNGCTPEAPSTDIPTSSNDKITPTVAPTPGFNQPVDILFEENFDDTGFSSRNWYDGITAAIDPNEHTTGSTSSLKCNFLKGGTKPAGGQYAFRHLFPATDNVLVSFWVKHSANWIGSGKPHHPHLMHLVTNLDGVYIGPSYTHLTGYIEECQGFPQMNLQDGLNIDETKINQNLIGVTENRAAMGCNGTQEGIGVASTDCYLSNGLHMNGTVWRAPTGCFFDPVEKTKWHFIEAYFQLNTIAGGIGQPDGSLRYWYDGQLLFDHSNVIMRTGAHATMLFNQFLIAPYIGDGSPFDQTIWFDKLTVATKRRG